MFLIVFTCCSGRYFSQSFTGIVLNEYSASNTSGPVDAFGSPSDWVEIHNPNTFSVSLQSYFLSNDPINLYKWQFPQNFVIPGGGLAVIWLSGRNTVKNGEYHANFTLEQCKNQWLILSTDAGTVRDSVFVQHTMAGHTRGRISNSSNGVAMWRVYTSPSFLQTNPPNNYYIGYAPTPSMVAFPNPVNPSPSPRINTGGFFNEGQAPVVYFKLENNQAYDKALSCFDIYYTVDGSFPGPGNGIAYTDSATSAGGNLLMSQTTMVRAVAYPKNTATCNPDYLPSFCQTNTYFIDPPHNDISPEFGVLSLAMDPAWFQTSGAFSPTIHAEYYDRKRQVSEGYAQINRPIQEDWRTKQRGMYINMDDRRGFGCAFEGNVFNVDVLGTTTRTTFPSLHLKAGDIESNSVPSFGGGLTFGTGLRDVTIQSLAAKHNIKVNPLHIKPVVTFINGRYYGVYNLYEIYDKHYEQFYNQQSPDSLTLAFYHNGDGFVSYVDGTSSGFNNDFDAKIYNEYVTQSKPLSNPTNYEKLMSELDKESFMDYMLVNSIIMNSNLWNYNVAYAKGGQSNFPGGKWHYYLWNVPAIYGFMGVQTNTSVIADVNVSPCSIYANVNTATVSPVRGNSHAVILNRLMDPNTGNKSFQLEYRNRMQDLLNGPFNCDNLKAHIEAIHKLYAKEMLYHSDPQTGIQFGTQIPPSDNSWDSLMLAQVVVPSLKKIAGERCFVVSTTLNKPGCFGLVGPFDIMVDVKPDTASGKVKLNTTVLQKYPWYGKYYSTTMGFRAIPSSTAFVFNHWELTYEQNAEDPQELKRNPLLLDSILYTFNRTETVVAVFTDKTQDLNMDGEYANIPTGFTPNGDGWNDVFRPLGSADYVSDYEMIIFSRWGEEVFRSTAVNQGWDGNYKGKPAVTGVYAYMIKYRNVKGETKTALGNVTLTR